MENVTVSETFEWFNVLESLTECVVEDIAYPGSPKELIGLNVTTCSINIVTVTSCSINILTVTWEWRLGEPGPAGWVSRRSNHEKLDLMMMYASHN